MPHDLMTAVQALGPKLVARRRELHRHPETAHNEEWTSHYLAAHFKALGIPFKRMAGTGLRAVLKGRPGGRTVALRTDMDALPLREEGAKPYESLNPGATHACAHDGHMAALMTAAEILAARRREFRGTVVFLCQPAEELPPGGARLMIAAGALEGVDAIFGLHLWQGLPTGYVGAARGPMMAQSDNFRLAVRGKGGHASMPQEAVDPIVAAAEVVTALQTVVSRNVDPLKPAVLSFGSIHGGAVHNVIPGEVSLLGTVRTFDPKVQGLIKRRMREIVDGTCRALGAAADFEYEDGYPPLVNDPASIDFALGVARKAFGDESVGLIEPVMGGEDFACYLQDRPGAFLFLGAGDGTKYPHHHPGFDIDERALAPAAYLLAALALEYLA